MKDNLKKNFIWNVVGSTINSFTSLFFLIIVTRINGIKEAGVFTFGFSTACLLQVIGNYCGRSYQVTNTDKELFDSDFILNRICSCIIMLIVSILFVLIKGYEIYKIAVIIFLVIYRLIESYSESLYGIIQKNGKLYLVGISLFLKAILGILGFLIIDMFTHDVILSITGIIISQLIILVFFDIKNQRKCAYSKDSFNFERIWKIFKYGFFVFLVTILSQYVINASKYAIDNYLADEMQTIYGILAMPATVMILCSQFLIHPFLMKMTQLLKKKNISEFTKLVIVLCLALLVMGVLAEIVVYFIGIPFLNIIYGIKLDDYLLELLIIVGGSIFFGISTIISNSMIAMNKNFVQSIIFIIGSIFTLIVSNIFVNRSGVMGASISYLLTMVIIFIMYVIVFAFEIKKYKRNNM